MEEATEAKREGPGQMGEWKQASKRGRRKPGAERSSIAAHEQSGPVVKSEFGLVRTPVSEGAGVRKAR